MTREEIKEIIIKFTGEKGWGLFCNSSGGKIGLDEFNKTFSIYEMIDLKSKLGTSVVLDLIENGQSSKIHNPYSVFLNDIKDYSFDMNKKINPDWNSFENLRIQSNYYFEKHFDYFFKTYRTNKTKEECLNQFIVFFPEYTIEKSKKSYFEFSQSLKKEMVFNEFFLII